MNYNDILKQAELFSFAESLTTGQALKLLDLNSNFSEEDLKRAYKKKVLQLHPDQNKSETAQSDFILMQRAYELLKNTEFDRDDSPAYEDDDYYTVYDNDTIYGKKISVDNFTRILDSDEIITWKNVDIKPEELKQFLYNELNRARALSEVDDNTAYESLPNNYRDSLGRWGYAIEAVQNVLNMNDNRELYNKISSHLYYVLANKPDKLLNAFKYQSEQILRSIILNIENYPIDEDEDEKNLMPSPTAKLASDNDPGQVFFDSYDYGGPEGPTATSPGRGLYSGNMNKYKSVSDFFAKKRKKKRKARRKKALLTMLSGNISK